MTSSLDELKSEIVTEISTELTALGESDISESIITLKVNDAVREAISERRYPNGFSDERVVRDLDRFYMNIKAKAMCKINKIGVEFEESHNENGTSRVYADYEKLSHGILPFAKVL